VAETKAYNDLLRRSVFSLVVIGLWPFDTPVSLLNGGIDLVWSEALNVHGITAWQPH
jgi:hypothetical protein